LRDIIGNILAFEWLAREGGTGMVNTAQSEAVHSKESLAPLGSAASAIERIPDPVETDSIDLHLLRLLAQDSRASQRQLAREVGMSAPAVGERIARLERVGVIRGYSIAVDWARLGYSMEVYLNIVTVPSANIGALIADLNSFPEVESVNIISGSFDLQALVRVRNHQHLTRLLIEDIWQLPSVQRTETLLSFASTRQSEFTASLLGYIEEQRRANQT
jgi:Lrp/AsnC family leucine-responsive transcriptional regulator